DLADGPARGNDHAGLDVVLPRRPRGRLTLPARRLLRDAHAQPALIDAQHLGARDHFDALLLGGRQLHAMRALLRGIRTPEVAQARAETAAHIDRELLGLVADCAAALHEQAVVVVDLLGRQHVDVVLPHVLGGALGEVARDETRHAPAADD